MSISLTFKTVGLTIATTTFAFAAPLSAQANSSNSDGQILGAIIGGVAGAALGDGIAPRGRSSEYGIIGGVLGGVAGAAIAGNGTSNNRQYNNGYYNRQTGYYQPRVNTGVTYSRPVYSTPAYTTTTYSRPVYSAPVVYSSPAYYDGYGYGGSNYGGTALSINIGTGGYYNRGSSTYGFSNIGLLNNPRTVRRRVVSQPRRGKKSH